MSKGLDGRYYVWCERCSCWGPPTLKSAENAAKLWNKRKVAKSATLCKRASKLPKKKHTGVKRKLKLSKSDSIVNNSWHYCHSCQIKRGGKVPRGGHRCITVTQGVCSMCKKTDTLVPNADYIWKGQKYQWD